MKPHEIKIEIYRRRPDGVTIASIARELGVAPQTVNIVISGHRTSRRIAVAVAKAIKRPFKDVFPSYANATKHSRKKAA